MAGSWAMFLIGSWAGVFIGFIIASMLAGPKLRDLELAKENAQQFPGMKRKMVSRFRANAYHHYSR